MLHYIDRHASKRLVVHCDYQSTVHSDFARLAIGEYGRIESCDVCDITDRSFCRCSTAYL